jgi:predicted RNA-binding Zn-ribbon protein involved in translation (DUF1610 family)
VTPGRDDPWPDGTTPPADRVACPTCGETMRRGHLTVRGTIVGFLLIGFSAQNLYFRWRGRGDSKHQDVKLIESGGTKTAFHCGKCGAVLAPGLKGEPGGIVW